MSRSLSQKLGMKPGHRVLVLQAPQTFLGALSPLPEGTSVDEAGAGIYDCVVAFVGSKADVERCAPEALRAIKPDGLLWFAYPKKSSAVATDISRDVGWDTLSAAGYRPVAQIAVDETWSALRFRESSLVKPLK